MHQDTVERPDGEGSHAMMQIGFVTGNGRLVRSALQKHNLLGIAAFGNKIASQSPILMIHQRQVQQPGTIGNHNNLIFAPVLPRELANQYVTIAAEQW